MQSLNKRLQKAESAAFVELYDLLGEQLFRYAYSQLGSTEDAADVVQNIFVQLVKSHRALSRADNLTGYVFATARNEIHRLQKKSQRHQTNRERSPQILNELPVENQPGDQYDTTDWIESTLSRLTPVDREIVQLKVFAKLTFDEIATTLNLKSANVTTRHRRALAKLERQLSEPSSHLLAQSENPQPDSIDE